MSVARTLMGVAFGASILSGATMTSINPYECSQLCNFNLDDPLATPGWFVTFSVFGSGGSCACTDPVTQDDLSLCEKESDCLARVDYTVTIPSGKSLQVGIFCTSATSGDHDAIIHSGILNECGASWAGTVQYFDTVGCAPGSSLGTDSWGVSCGVCEGVCEI